MASTQPQDGQRALEVRNLVLDLRNFSTATKRASEAVGRGNQKVFEEIGYEFARFISWFNDGSHLDNELFNQFCEGLRPGDPPEGQDYLRQAFRHYYQAVFTTDTKSKAELIFLANLEIGFHEQTRLQPEIAESLDAGWNSLRDIFHLLANLFPFKGLLAWIGMYVMRILGRPTDLDRDLSQFLSTIQVFLRKTITELMMSIDLPSGVQLRLGEDLEVRFAPSLETITVPEAKHLLAKSTPPRTARSIPARWIGRTCPTGCTSSPTFSAVTRKPQTCSCPPSTQHRQPR